MFRDASAQKELEQWYARFLSKVDAPHEDLSVSTSHGDNHVLAVGEKDAPALVCVHGAMASSAHTAAEPELE